MARVVTAAGQQAALPRIICTRQYISTRLRTNAIPRKSERSHSLALMYLSSLYASTELTTMSSTSGPSYTRGGLQQAFYLYASGAPTHADSTQNAPHAQLQNKVDNLEQYLLNYRNSKRPAGIPAKYRPERCSRVMLRWPHREQQCPEIPHPGTFGEPRRAIRWL